MTPGVLRPLRAFSRLLGELRRSEPWGRRLSRHRVFLIWEEAVGEAVARVARPADVRRGRLRVEVADSTWLQELQMSSEALLARLNEHLEGEELEEIRFRLTGASAAFGHREEARVPVPKGVEYNRFLSPAVEVEDERSIAQALQNISDDEVREGLERLLSRARRGARRGESPPGAVKQGREQERR